MLPTQSQPLTFHELAVGEKFISFPQDGDDSGHGGYRGEHNLFMKISYEYRTSPVDLVQNAVNIGRGVFSNFPETALVLRVK